MSNMERKRVLFIEDEEELVRDLPPILKSKGFEVTATTDVAEALRLFAESDFDVVLTDIAMPPAPDMDGKALAYGRETGVEVARRLHAIRTDIPIVALTVIRDQQIVSRMRKAGIRDILHKPQELQRIVETLERVTRW
ncbi:MAG: response regulator [Sedimentisphaerales bacterium]